MVIELYGVNVRYEMTVIFRINVNKFSCIEIGWTVGRQYTCMHKSLQTHRIILEAAE
jgi:hypothetical protein